MSSKRTIYRDFATTREVLVHEWELRKSRNKAFSLRAFARQLQLSPSFLSDLVNDKSRLSPASACDVGTILKLDALDRQYLCDLATLEIEKSGLRTKVVKARVEKYRTLPSLDNLVEDKFRLVNDWYHPAIVELAKTHDFVCDAAWIGKRLGITSNQVIDALVRLEEVGVIRFTTSQTFELTMTNPSVAGGYPSSVIRNYHASLMKLAARALESQSLAERTISSHTIAFPKNRLEEVRNRIQEFRLSLAKEIQEMGDCDEVYALCVQFFRLSEPKQATQEPSSQS